MEENIWYVIGRSQELAEHRQLLVECQRTGKLGSVAHFTEAQWEMAARASFDAFRWLPKWGEVLELTASVA